MGTFPFSNCEFNWNEYIYFNENYFIQEIEMFNLTTGWLENKTFYISLKDNLKSFYLKKIKIKKKKIYRKKEKQII